MESQFGIEARVRITNAEAANRNGANVLDGDVGTITAHDGDVLWRVLFDEPMNESDPSWCIDENQMELVQ